MHNTIWFLLIFSIPLCIVKHIIFVYYRQTQQYWLNIRLQDVVILHMFQTTYYICFRLHIIYVSDYILHMFQTTYYICFRLHITYVSDYILHMFQTTYYICFRLHITYVSDYILHMFQAKYYICFRLHVSAVKRPSSGLYRASHVKYNGFGTQWDPIVFTVVLQ